jgi:cobalt-zinc-cadmium efflux system protein
VFFVAEVIGGLVSNSLALLADAGHMFTDVGALSLSLFVAWFSRQPSAPEKTYGYLRWEILAALLNGAVLLLVSGLIVWEAIGRLQTPEPVAGGLMMLVAVGGLVVNAASAAVLHPQPQRAGRLPARPGRLVRLRRHRGGGRRREPDRLACRRPPCFHGRDAARDPIGLASRARVRRRPARGHSFAHIHDLHVWTVTSGMVAMSAHAVVREPAENQKVLEAAVAAMQHLGISHVTLQVERDRICEAPCP